MVTSDWLQVSSLASHMDTGDLSLQHNTTGHGGDGAVIAVRSQYCTSSLNFQLNMRIDFTK